MDRQHFIYIFFLSLFLILITTFGCSTAKSLTQKITEVSPKSLVNAVHKIMPEKDYLKKRILVLPLINQATLGSKIAEQTTANLITLLKESPHLLVYEAPKTMSLPSEIKSSEFGIVTHPEVIRMAEDLNMNALITGVINPVEINTKKSGIWPFRKTCRTYDVSVVINAVDVFSKTLLLTRLESENMLAPVDSEDIEHDEGLVDRVLRKVLPSSQKQEASPDDRVPIPGEETQTPYDSGLMDQVLSKAMSRILERQASGIIETLLAKPWTGKILAVDDGTIAINAGKEIGLKPHQEFEVFARAEFTTPGNDRSFDILGEKVGKIRTTSVMEKDSLAVPVKEGAFLVGQIIRFSP